MTKKFDQFDRLVAPGQHVFIPGVRPMRVSKLAKSNVRRRLGPRAVVVSAYISEIDSTFVALAYVPTTAPVSTPEPRSESYELTEDDLKRMENVAAIKVRNKNQEPEPDEPDEWEKLDGQFGSNEE